jgi:hypothetical protein
MHNHWALQVEESYSAESPFSLFFFRKGLINQSLASSLLQLYQVSVRKEKRLKGIELLRSRPRRGLSNNQRSLIHR